MKLFNGNSMKGGAIPSMDYYLNLFWYRTNEANSVKLNQWKISESEIKVKKTFFSPSINLYHYNDIMQHYNAS